MDKWEKVVCLHGLLRRSRYAVPRDAILRELECSPATFYRLRTFLRDCLGAPLAYHDRYGGYYYDDQPERRFELPGLWLSRDELQALCCMEYAAESLQGGPLLGDAVNALRKRFEPLFEAQRIKPHAFRDRIRILSMGGRRTDPAVFKTLAEAILRKKRVSVRHRRLRDDTLVQRTLSPYRLVRYRDNWYLDGYCHLRDRLRELAVSRIEAAEPAPGRFHSVPKAELEAFFADAYGIFTGKATATARIVFTGVAAREVSKEQWHPRQHGEWLPDGSYRLSIPYGDPRELIMDVLRWGSAARVTAPKKLRDQVRRTLKESLDLYDTGRVSRSESEEGYTTTDGRTDLYKGADEHGTVSG